MMKLKGKSRLSCIAQTASLADGTLLWIFITNQVGVKVQGIMTGAWVEVQERKQMLILIIFSTYIKLIQWDLQCLEL